MFKFNYQNFILFLLLLIIEVCIALFVKQHFIRGVLGDFLVVIMLYYLFRSFFNLKPKTVAILVLAIAYITEFLQIINILEFFKLENNKLISILLGTTFSVNDLIAYTLGIIIVIFIEKKLNT